MDQMTFDPDEWDNFASFRIRKGRLIAWLCTLVGIVRVPYLVFVLKHGWKAVCTAGMSRFYVLKDRIKTKKCKQCAYEKICDYIYYDYYTIYGDAEMIPIRGRKINNPAWSMKAATIREPGELPRKFQRIAINHKLPWPNDAEKQEIIHGGKCSEDFNS